MANCSSQPAAVPGGSLPDLDGPAELLLSTHPGAMTPTLAPWESRIYLRR